MVKNTEKTALKKGQAKFQLVGAAKITDYTYKLEEQSQKSDWVYNVLNLGTNCGNGNIVYSELMGGYGAERDNVLYVHGKKENENKKMVDDYDNTYTIDWEDRFDEAVLESIGDNCFINIGLEKDTKGKTFSQKFLSPYDAIAYVNEHLEDGMIVNVKGDLKFSQYNDNIQAKKEINSIFLSKVEDESKFKANFIQTILISTDSVQKLDKEKAVFPIDAYVVDYVGKTSDGTVVKQNVVFNKTFELAVDKTNPENTKKIITKLFKPSKKNSLVEITVEGDLIESQSIVNITEDDIPDDIKELIDLGAYTMEEAMSKCAVGGSTKEKRMVIKKPSITYVGKGEDRKPTVAVNKDKYVETDLVFLSQLLIDSEDENEKTEDKAIESKDTIIDDEKSKDTENNAEDDNAWMKALGDL